MGLLQMILGVALLGATPAADAGDDSTSIPVLSFQIRLFQLKGVDWRADVHNRLEPVEHSGSYSVWTAPRSVVDDLQKVCEKTVTAPKVCTYIDAKASISDVTVRNHVADVRRVADAPEGSNTCVVIMPVLASLRDGFEAQVSGHPAETGMVVKATLTDTRFIAFHTASIPKTYVDAKTKETCSTSGTVQVPEVVKSIAAGEWVVPNDAVLVVSLGTHSTTDSKGKSTIQERVVVIDPTKVAEKTKTLHARQVPTSSASHQGVSVGSLSIFPIVANSGVPTCATEPMAVAPSMILPLVSPTIAPQPAWRTSLSVTASAGVSSKQAAGGVSFFGVKLPVAMPPFVSLDVKAAKRPAEKSAAPMPALPSRGLPTAIAADGTVVPLPPLPEVDLSMAADDDSAEPRPAPQSQRKDRPTTVPADPIPERESALAQVTRFEARGNTLILRDAATGASKVICDELILSPANRTDLRRTISHSDDQDDCCANECCQTASRLAQGLPDRADRNAIPVEYLSQDDSFVDQDDITTLGFQLNSSRRGCEYDSTVSVKNLNKEPITLRIPMADGSVVEVTAKMVKPATK